VVLVITQHDLPEPRTDFGHALMHPALKLSLDGFELRDHSLLRSDPPYGEGLWFSLSPLLPVSNGEPPELDQSCLVRM